MAATKSKKPAKRKAPKKGDGSFNPDTNPAHAYTQQHTAGVTALDRARETLTSLRAMSLSIAALADRVDGCERDETNTLSFAIRCTAEIMEDLARESVESAVHAKDVMIQYDLKWKPHRKEE